MLFFTDIYDSNREKLEYFYLFIYFLFITNIVPSRGGVKGGGEKGDEEGHEGAVEAHHQPTIQV